MAITYIREIENTLRILAWGYVGAGGLGEFDTDIYQEVVGVESLPNGYVMIEQVNIAQQLNDLFATIPLETYTPEQKVPIYNMKSNMDDALAYQDYQTVAYIISNTVITPSEVSFDGVKSQMLAVLP